MAQQFDINAARQAGASDDQILSYLSQRSPSFDVNGALKQGTSKVDVINYLSVHATPPASSSGVSGSWDDPPSFYDRLTSGYDPGAAAFGEKHPILGPAVRFASAAGGAVLGLPGSIYHAVADDLTPEEQQEFKGHTQIPGEVALERLTGAPLVRGAQQYANPQTRPTLSQAASVLPEALGQGAGTVVGAELGSRSAGALLRKAVPSRVQAPLGDTVSKPRGSIAPDSYTPTELKAYADENGIPLNAAQATQHNLPRNLMSAGERATVGGSAVRQQVQASQAAVASHAENLMDSFSPQTPDVATAGDQIRQNVSQALEREQVASRQDYAAIDQKANGVKVDLRPLKDTANRILSDSNFVRNVGSLDPKRAASILQDIQNNLPDEGSFSQAQQLRSALLDVSRTPELAISTQVQGWIKQLTGTVDSEMMNAARSKPGLEPQFRAANNRWTQLQEDFNNPRSPLFQALQQPDPSKIPQLFTQRGQIGGSPYNAQLLDRYGIDKAPVKWSIMNDLASKDFRLWSKNLGGYGDDFLRSVFSPTELDQVYKTGAIARSVGMNTNPSGTAGVSSAIEDVNKPIRSLLPKGMAARATKSPGFNRWMMQPRGQPQPVNPGRVPLSVLLGTQALRRQSPDEE